MKTHFLTLLLMSLGTCLFVATPGNANAGVKDLYAASGKTISFIENKGQVTDQNDRPRNDIQFKMATNNGLNIFIGSGAIHYQFITVQRSGNSLADLDGQSPKKQPEITGIETYRMDVELIGANPNAKVLTEAKQDYYENYYTSQAGLNGITMHSYGKITYKDIYPNIDWVLYTQNGQLKHEFVVRPGGDVSAIKLKYGGATALNLGTDGSLAAATPKGTITEHAPHSYTTNNENISSSFRLVNNIVSYTVGNYAGTLIIDPNIVWATYCGGYDGIVSMTHDANNNVYIAGNTIAKNNVATTGAYQLNFAGGVMDGFIAKYTAGGSLAWGTYFGGPWDEWVMGIAADGKDNLYITGWTNSVTGIDPSGTFTGGQNDVMLIRFNTQGQRIWGRYIGGKSSEWAYGVACNNAGAYVTGFTQSLTGIATPGTHQQVHSGPSDPNAGHSNDAFLVYYDSAGNKLMGTYLHSDVDAGFAEPHAIATDPAGNAYITGYTTYTDGSGFVSNGCYQPVKKGDYDCFLAKFNITGQLLWSTYYGGDGHDQLFGIAVNNTGDVYAVGRTNSSLLDIITPGCHQQAYGGEIYDGLIVKFDSSGMLKWSTYYGGAKVDMIFDADCDPAGNLVACGWTESWSGIATSGSYQSGLRASSRDGFFAIFDASGTRQWASYVGGGAEEDLTAVTTDGLGNIYLAGGVGSDDLATPGSNQPVKGDSYGYLAKFSAATTSISSASIAGNYSIYPNPAEDFVFISSKTAIRKIELFDLAGREVITRSVNSNNNRLDIHDLAPGIYLLKLDGEYAAKVLKQ